ncbi:MAG: endoribonuclease [Rhodocyclales bacterium]|nr:endoribonuclease [Rhodocyclales bacterium]
MNGKSAPSSRHPAAGALSLRVSFEGMSAVKASAGLLGAVWHADVTDHTEADIQVAMPSMLADQAGVLEQWRVDGDVREGRLGPALFRCTDKLLFVAISIDEPLTGQTRDIAGAAQQAYAALFEVMAAEGFAHLVRCWNYFADINQEQVDQGGVLERYRLFNIGRQAAFEASEHSAEVGAPAACALGTHGGPLTIYALAARSEPRSVENPRQVSAYRYPRRYGPKSPSFSRGSVLSDAAGGHVLFISGTASIVGHESVHVGDVVAQTEESLRNIVTVVAQANLGLGSEVFSSHKLCYKVFVRNPADAPVVADTVRRVLGMDMGEGKESGEATDMVVLQADVCRAELLVEIEAVGFA